MELLGSLNSIYTSDEVEVGGVGGRKEAEVAEQVEVSSSKEGTELPPTNCTAAVPATHPASRAAPKSPPERSKSTKKAPAKASPAPHVSCTWRCCVKREVDT